VVEGLGVSPDDVDEVDEDVEDEDEDDGDEDPESEPPSDVDVDPPAPSLAPSPDDAFDARVAFALPRSFLAQPEPLKWIVGGANSLRIVPSRPHDGQKLGPGSLIPWRMSARWSQAVQTYS
jgi:hypothetical protein